MTDQYAWVDIYLKLLTGMPLCRYLPEVTAGYACVVVPPAANIRVELQKHKQHIDLISFQMSWHIVSKQLRMELFRIPLIKDME